MIKHAMHYVQRAENVSKLVGAKGIITPEREALGQAAYDLVKAEQNLVAAYRTWRDAMAQTAESETINPQARILAQRYLEESNWDLT